MTINEWLKSIGWTQSRLAEELGMTRSYINLVCKGKKGASPQVAYAIQKLSGGKVSAQEILIGDADPLALCRKRAA